MRTLSILLLCLVTTFSYAQKQMSKSSQSIKVNKDVIIDLNTNYVEIELDTWNKDVVEVEAYIESNVLSDEDLKRALEAWNLDVKATNDRVIISSQGGRNVAAYTVQSYDELLRDLEFELADIPEMPEVVVMPQIPNMEGFPALPKMPKMPKFPELPELPEGVKSISFDYDRYQKEGEKYLSEWSKRYEQEGGKELQKAMEEWAKKFEASGYQKKMEEWGEEYAKQFEGKWAKEMEEWGEKFGEGYAKDMEKWGESFGEEWAKQMEAWGENLAKRMEKQAAKMEKGTARMAEQQAQIAERAAMRAAREAERAATIAERNEKLREKHEAITVKGYKSAKNTKLKKVIKIKIPKKAKLNMNVRHGELKVSSVLFNAKGDISHSFLLAEHIDGGETSINVSYSPVVINTWHLGTLNLDFVDQAQIENAVDLVLNSKSSNITIKRLKETGIIDGSFGDLMIANIDETFKNLNLVLENSDAMINLPKSIDYNLYFKGNRSKLNNKPTSQKTIRKNNNGTNTNGTIMVNAKFSNVILN